MSQIKANKWLHSDGTETTEVDVPSLDQRMAHAWCNWNGTGTVAIRNSYNISSISDFGTGDFVLNYTNALSNADHVVVYSAQVWSTWSHVANSVVGSANHGASSGRCVHRENTATLDSAHNYAIAFGN